MGTIDIIYIKSAHNRKEIMVRFIFASHYNMAEGLKNTISFLTSTDKCLYDISAYMSEKYDIEKEIESLLDTFDKDDKVVIMTDVLAGSVNQKFIPYIGNNIFLITGINVPLALELVLTPEDNIDTEHLKNSVMSARETILFVNEMPLNIDEEDE